MGAKPAEVIDIKPSGTRAIVPDNREISDKIVKAIYNEAELIANKVVNKNVQTVDFDRRLDDILTSRLFGYPIMILILGIILWLTISGANYPSQLLSDLLFGVERQMGALFLFIGAPDWLYGFLVLGVYRSLAWVVSVMLPPMAIFFPL